MNQSILDRVHGLMISPLIRFLLIGGISTLIDYTIYTFISQLIHVVLAKLWSMLCSTFFAFLLNKNWTFQRKEQSWILSLKKYYIAQAANITVNVSVNALIFWLSDNRTIAFIVATAIAMSVNFLLQKFYVFLKSQMEEA